MFANDVQDRRSCTSRVVQICQAVGKARSQMEQAHRRLGRHPAVAVGRSSRDVLVEAKDAAHTGDLIHRENQGQFRRARICETDLDAFAQCGRDECLRTVHGPVPLVRSRKSGPNFDPTTH
jgi:hypothetical protein